MTRRRVRARTRLVQACSDLPFAYAYWIASTERNPEREAHFRTAIEDWSIQPRFALMLYSETVFSSAALAQSLKSIARQIYPHWSLLGAPEESFTPRITTVEADYLIPLRVGDELSDVALFRYADALQADRDISILYGDQDEFDQQGRRSRPWFKPRWNEEMFLAQDFLSRAVAIKADLARQVATTHAPTDVESLVLRATSAAKSIVHVPHILCHANASRLTATGRRLEAVAEYLAPTGASCAPGNFGSVKVEWPLPAELPLVSIIVPTKDKLEVLKPCIESLLRLTTYGNFEILIVDNGSTEPETARFLAEVSANNRVRVIEYPVPYNFSAINNFAIRHARGDYLCLLNNDTEIVAPDWLTELMRYAIRLGIGAVGAKLLYEDRSIQHAGVVIGIGDAAGHAHRFLPADQPGYFCQAHVAQFVSAVTAACLVVEKKKFEAIGGFDEKDLAIAFNDVDFCLRLERAGYRNVYVPHAVLLHHESKSRGNDLSPENIDRYRRELKVLQERWATKIYADPLHNPNLDRYSETFVIGL
jgi:GT2 family glycosyltransferase